MKIVVAGGGMAGLALAPLLAGKGHSVTIVEKRGLTRLMNGSGISYNLTLNADARETLQQLGLLDQALALGTPLSHRTVHLGEEIKIQQPYGMPNIGWLLSIRRRDLHELFLAPAREACVSLRFESVFVSQDARRRAVTISHRGRQEVLQCDLLVGADGAFSTIRKALVQTEALDCILDTSGWKYKKFDIPASCTQDLRADVRNLHIWGAGDHMAVGIPNRDQSVSCILIFRAEGEGNEEAALSRATTHLTKRYPELANLLWQLADARTLGQFVEVTVSRWSMNAVVLVGDACHAMYPFCGLGLNTALGDVLELAHQIGSGRSVELALQFYEDARRPVANEAQALSRAQLRVLLDLAAQDTSRLNTWISS
jgi:kynurenine 3-monooxygenase